MTHFFGMKLRILLALLLAAPVILQAEPPASEKSAPASHPLKGVVVEIRKDRQALLVKHEEIPGVMRAMTMLLKVEPAVLEQVKPGDTITARLSRREDGWWLHDVKVAAAPQSK